jgi:hypothetical protein
LYTDRAILPVLLACCCADGADSSGSTADSAAATTALLATAPALAALLPDAAAATRVLALWPQLQALLQRTVVPLFTAVTAARKQSKLSSAVVAAVQSGRECLLLALQSVLTACKQCNHSSKSSSSDVTADVAFGEPQFTKSLLQGRKTVINDATTLRAQSALLQWLRHCYSTSTTADNSASTSLQVQFVWYCVSRAAAAMRTTAKLTAAAVAAASSNNTSKSDTTAVSAAAAEAECALQLVCKLLQERSSSSTTAAVALALTAEAVTSVNAFFTAALKYRLADALALDAVRLLAAALYGSDHSDSSSTGSSSSSAAAAVTTLGMWSAEDLYARTVGPLVFVIICYVQDVIGYTCVCVDNVTQRITSIILVSVLCS